MCPKVRGLVIPTMLPKFDYIRPNSLKELLEIKNELGNEGLILAGGTDLLIDLRLRTKKVKTLIDIKGIKELRTLTYESGKGLSIGALVTLKELLDSDIVKSKYYVLWKAISVMGDFILRNRATLVGNICNASPASDSAPALLVYNAEVEIASVEGNRVVKLKDFFVGPKKTVLKPNEVVTRIHIPEPPRNAYGDYLKFVRTSEDLAIVGIAALVANRDSPSRRIVRLAYASVAPTPILIEDIERIFRKKDDVRKLISDAVNIVLSNVSPITDVRGTKEYRLHLIEYGTRYLLNKLLEVS